MGSLIINIIERTLRAYRRYKCYKFYAMQFKKYMASMGFENRKAVGENEYIAKWKILSTRVEPYSYRFYCHYVGFTPNIVPEDIGRSYIEPVLNPPIYRGVYADKNMFPEIIGKQYVPRTILCRINGSNLLDGNFQKADKEFSCYFDGVSDVILKPSVESSSGVGIIKFVKSGGTYISVDGEHELTRKFLMTYNLNFCLQEVVRQHDFMNHLCRTCVNTVRLCLYKSVRDETPKVTASIIRIGKDGSFVDNAHAGGMFIGVDLKTGMLANYVIDHRGYKSNEWNGIDFSSSNFVVPNWNDIVSFAEFVGTRIHHHRLIALDIALERSGKPILIEYNIRSFSYWFYLLTGQNVFGDYTDEVIDYCRKNARN